MGPRGGYIQRPPNPVPAAPADLVSDSENHCSRDAHLGTRRRGHNHAKLWQLGRTGSDGSRLRILPLPKNNLQASFSRSVPKRKSRSSRSPFSRQCLAPAKPRSLQVASQLLCTQQLIYRHHLMSGRQVRGKGYRTGPVSS